MVVNDMVALDMSELTGGSPWWANGQLQSIEMNSGYGYGYLSLVRSFQSGISIGVQNFSLYGDGAIRLFSGMKANPPVIAFAICFSGIKHVSHTKPRFPLGDGFSYIEFPGYEPNLFMDVNSNTPIQALAVLAWLVSEVQ